MLNICKNIDDSDNTCDLIAAQIGVFTMYASDGQMLTAKITCIAFCVRHSRGEMHIVLATGVCVSVCLIPRRIPTLLRGPGCNLGELYILGGFAIGARVSLL